MQSRPSPGKAEGKEDRRTPVLTVAVSEKAARTNSRRMGSAISSAIAIWLAPRSTASGVSNMVPYRCAQMHILAYGLLHLCAATLAD